MQTWRFVVHFVFNRNKIFCIHDKVLDSSFQMISKMLLHFFNFVSHWVKIITTVYFPEPEEKCSHFTCNQKKCVICSNS